MKENDSLTDTSQKMVQISVFIIEEYREIMILCLFGHHQINKRQQTCQLIVN